MLTHRGPRDADTTVGYRGCQLSSARSGHPPLGNTLHRKILSEQERGAAWTLPAAGRTRVMLVGQTGASSAWLDPVSKEGTADPCAPTYPHFGGSCKALGQHATVQEARQ